MSTFYVDPKRDHVTAEEWAKENVPYMCGNCEALIEPVNPGDRRGPWRHHYDEEICDEGETVPNPCHFVEFGLLYDDHTWATEVVEVPMVYMHDRCENEDLIDWANAVLAPLAAYRKVVQFTVYSIGNPGE